MGGVREGGQADIGNFAYGGNVCMISILGDIAIRHKGKSLRYDAKAGKFRTALRPIVFQRPYRKGWELPT